MSITHTGPIAGHSRTASARLREKMETAIEKLITALDALEDTDTDASSEDAPFDAEPDEHSLGWTEMQARFPYLDDQHFEDGEEQDEDGDEADREPSLGWPENGVGNASSDDCEL